MRRQFVECASWATARRRCPWAAVVARASGGFLCFESVTDWQTWKRQT